MQLDEGGFVAVRLGPGLVMLEAHGDAPPVGAMVRLEAPAVTLYDTGI